MAAASGIGMGTAEVRVARPHFAVLDGLRGVAAIGVVVFHFMEMVIGNYSKLWIGHGYLAVDFFFCLSGFVMGYAYDDRMKTLGFAQFAKQRLIRLHPLVVLGTMLGVLTFYVNPFGVTPGYTPGKMAVLFLAGVLMIPIGGIKERGNNCFCLNAPAWSLFWEYVANVVFALVLVRLKRGALIVLTVLAAAALCWYGHQQGNLMGGWSTRVFWGGGVRVASAFLGGLLVYRMGWRLRTKLGFFGLSVLLLLAMVSPYAKGAWGREAAIDILYFPLLIALGAGATVGPRVEKLCKFSGDLSYPLYMTHYSVIWIWGDFADKHHLERGGTAPYVILGTITMVAFGTLVMVAYDLPVRAWLKRTLKG